MNDSYGQAFAVSESDTVDFRPGFVSDALWVGGLGNVVVLMADGKEATFTAVPAGTLLPIACKRLMTASTATNILALKR